MKIDLHSHTTHSDGNDSPSRLLQLAKAAGVDVLALTDHDSTEGVAEALEAGAREGVRVVAGIEVSSRFEGRDVHVLGIGVDVANAAMQAKLEDMRAKRRERVDRICAALAAAGKTLSPGQVLAEAKGKSVGRKHVARAMVKAGLVAELQEAFDRYLGEGKPANVPTVEVTPAEACRLVRGAGGVPSLAHPGFFDDDYYVERLLDSAAFRAIEVYHRYDSVNKHLRYAGIARRRDLIMTGGSDFHGDDHAHNAKLGEFSTPPDEWRKLSRLIN